MKYQNLEETTEQIESNCCFKEEIFVSEDEEIVIKDSAFFLGRQNKIINVIQGRGAI